MKRRCSSSLACRLGRVDAGKSRAGQPLCPLHIRSPVQLLQSSDARATPEDGERGGGTAGAGAIRGGRRRLPTARGRRRRLGLRLAGRPRGRAERREAEAPPARRHGRRWKPWQLGFAVGAADRRFGAVES